MRSGIAPEEQDTFDAKRKSLIADIEKQLQQQQDVTQLLKVSWRIAWQANLLVRI